MVSPFYSITNDSTARPGVLTDGCSAGVADDLKV
jgi:hypothetical protein